MFQNRSLQVKLVKDETLPPWEEQPITVDEISKVTTDILFGATVVLGTYLALDTVRQIVVHTAQTKIK